MKKYFLLFLFVGTLSISHAQENEISAMPFLDINPSVKSRGVGNSGAALGNDPMSIGNILAKTIFDEGHSIYLSYIPSFVGLGVKDIYLMDVAGIYQFRQNQVFSGSIRYFSLGTFDYTTAANTSIGSAFLYEVAADIGYSLQIFENMSTGITLRYAYSDLGKQSFNFVGQALMADFSTFYRKIDRNDISYSGGIALRNLGNRVTYDENRTSDPLPTNFLFALAIKMPLDMPGNEFELSASSKQHFTSYNTYNFGATYSYLDLDFRIGYAIENTFLSDYQAVSFGVGAKYQNILLDISYSLYTKTQAAVTNSYAIGLGYKF